MNNQLQPELLAPAGSPDAGWAAFTYGADAVYAGLPRFSARAEANNFSETELNELIGYAHAHGRKVYITFNTLVQQNELSAALESLAMIDDLNADGVIVQDMGVARMVKKFFPKLDLHASTQLAAHNLDGAKLLADVGFSRVVLARELSLREIETIAQDCGIETEVFIHGALCYSYSGLCLFSSHMMSRSGNRGRCAYCCRQTFDIDHEKGLPFSMQDFAVGEHFNDLLNAGVSSLKIEGRMKGPAYVGAVTDFYRKRIEKQIGKKEQEQLLSDIQTIFGRPATDLYLKNENTNPIDPTTNGHRGAAIGTIDAIRPDDGEHWLYFRTNRALQKYDGLKIELSGMEEPFGFSATEIYFQNDRNKHLKFEIPANSEIAVKLPDDHPYFEPGLQIYCSISQEIRQRYGFEAPRPGTFKQRRPLNVSVVLTNEGIQLTAESEGTSAELTIDELLSEARQPEKTEAGVKKCFGKTGDTEWELDQLELTDNGLFAPASILNDARRQLLVKLSSARKEKLQLEHASRLAAIVVSPSEAKDKERWSIKLRDLSLLDELTDEERSMIDEVVLESETPQNECRMAIPVIQRKDSSTVECKRVEVANIGALNKCEDIKSITADWPLYTLNSEAAAQWMELGIQQFVLSPEDTGENLKTLTGLFSDRAITPIYQHTPLMISATKPDCGDTISDRQKRDLLIERNGDQYVLVSEEPFSLIEHINELREAGARNFRIDFCYGTRDAQHAAETFRRIVQGIPCPGSYDGNYSRTL